MIICSRRQYELLAPPLYLDNEKSIGEILRRILLCEVRKNKLPKQKYYLNETHHTLISCSRT